MHSPTQNPFIALALSCWMASATGCAEGAPQPFEPSSPVSPGDQALASNGGVAGMESTVWRGTPVDSLPYHHGAAGSGAESEYDAMPPAAEQGDSVSDTLLLDDDPVDPDPPAPAPAPADANQDPDDSASDAAADPFQALFPPATGAAPDRTPSPDNPAECPDEAPENPLGPCAGLPVYIVCTYGTYTCICDWVHWMCAG